MSGKKHFSPRREKKHATREDLILGLLNQFGSSVETDQDKYLDLVSEIAEAVDGRRTKTSKAEVAENNPDVSG
ncbi:MULTISPECIES: hypothetical protein [Acetobacter]|uniref:Uncharacterized protein n=2 Tax=Acetobacter TaxID=434 RepID=A0AAN1PGI8_9PROT|nr:MULTISPECIES: hypothetical protein [Acetobacter]ASL40845.1 hypothetical protein CBI36_10715 [Acetobacter oryzifermentans]AXM99807.1 hypothetical protein CJF59_04085 [Acetobacter pomorum]KAA8383478.1 hypothetical protein FKW31_15050 [Acetobacter sp. DmW_136]KAA8393889.1 hypothetical protein FKW19_13570 [Acetobacter sp. DmW_125128]KAA8396843.1 hypothetical protein FKW20_10165 [Acetobacter sp. DmW_125127]